MAVNQQDLEKLHVEAEATVTNFSYKKPDGVERGLELRGARVQGDGRRRPVPGVALGRVVGLVPRSVGVRRVDVGLEGGHGRRPEEERARQRPHRLRLNKTQQKI